MARRNANNTIDNTWYDLLESKVYNKVSKRIRTEIGTEVFCTTDEINVSEAEFPAVWIHELEYFERGMDLTNISINAVLYSMQIDVFAATKAESRKIMKYAVAAMKDLNFNITTMPISMQMGADLYHTVARFRRMIGAGDKI